MLKSKKVADLIEDTQVRIDVVQTFLNEIRGNVGENFVTPISDPFGPAITDSNLSCIVGSDETKRGCEKINEIRRNLPIQISNKVWSCITGITSSDLFIFQ